MATIEQFNVEIERAKRDNPAGSIVIWRENEGSPAIYPYRKTKASFLRGAFQSAITGGYFHHVALIANCHVMAIWHALPDAGNVAGDDDLHDEDVYIDEPVNSKPLRVVTVDNCCDEVEALIQERDKLLRSEDAYHVENERLRAALFKISRLIAPPGELIAMGGDGYIMRVLHIIDEALAEPVK